MPACDECNDYGFVVDPVYFDRYRDHPQVSAADFLEPCPECAIECAVCSNVLAVANAFAEPIGLVCETCFAAPDAPQVPEVRT